MKRFFSHSIEWIESHLFGLVYAAIAVFTFSHTTNSIAGVFEGVNPGGNSASWYFYGGLGAVAVDIGMYATANALSKKGSWFMIFGFIICAATSFLTQLV